MHKIEAACSPKDTAPRERLGVETVLPCQRKQGPVRSRQQQSGVPAVPQTHAQQTQHLPLSSLHPSPRIQVQTARLHYWWLMVRALAYFRKV